MTAHGLFPERIETDRLVFEQFGHETIDLFAVYEFLRSEAWQDAALPYMPWFAIDRLDQLVEFVDKSERQWADGETARYLLRRSDDGERLGLTALGPEWDTRRAGSGIVLSRDAWGNGYASERARTFVAMTFEVYDLDAYYTTCAADNERSRRMIESVVETFGGRHEGLLRQHSPRPDGSVTDQHRFTITREEYESARSGDELADVDLTW